MATNTPAPQISGSSTSLSTNSGATTTSSYSSSCSSVSHRCHQMHRNLLQNVAEGVEHCNWKECQKKISPGFYVVASNNLVFCSEPCYRQSRQDIYNSSTEDRARAYQERRNTNQKISIIKYQNETLSAQNKELQEDNEAMQREIKARIESDTRFNHMEVE